MRSGRFDSRNHAASGLDSTQDASSRLRRLPGGGEPCAQRQRSHCFHIARVGPAENPRRVGLGGIADRSRLYRSQILQEGPHVKALTEIYTIHSLRSLESFAQLSKLNFC